MIPSAGLEPPLGLLLGRPGGKEMETAPGRHVAGMYTPFLLHTVLRCIVPKLRMPCEGVPGSPGLAPSRPVGSDCKRNLRPDTMAPGLAHKRGERTPKVCFRASTVGLEQLVWCQCKPVSPGLTEK